ncbi:TetR/AcrR family transcriptional regulator [Streptomyces albireticuli]|uniref:TetR family transcriptional regulator n=1 Tax=Streptomyces albireticuli TaxID=1940 RepID=A0A2A2CZH0_9ACTN|nr:TetR/AcrR family transcriptional regulator [Streptomyces albireticuli]MCD9142659.1 TetR/AcrR family transcriptional regulator [Streptomyces albireticuli]MCD9164058.1 TetR/AcrR family transcriptional regulator [Streptomyces albireticuli]MCD9192787.1 TetR/AcrR family transcriptional regulator [Streptomyces albireticuli]PAU44480.1 TetR family transcriptional regulator [Streptomyces albireticuli]
MARPRKFDEERAVDAAMEAFWTAGYEATSTQDLCDATGLGRSSIYNAFKSKHDLFQRALGRYLETKTASLTELLESDLPAREKVRAMLERIVEEECAHAEDGRGCLFVNTAVELAARDAEVARELERDYRRRLEALTAALEAGQRDGDIDTAKDARTLAHFVAAAIGGMRVSARAGIGRAALEGIARTTVDAL